MERPGVDLQAEGSPVVAAPGVGFWGGRPGTADPVRVARVAAGEKSPSRPGGKMVLAAMVEVETVEESEAP